MISVVQSIPKNIKPSLAKDQVPKINVHKFFEGINLDQRKKGGRSGAVPDRLTVREVILS